METEEEREKEKERERERDGEREREREREREKGTGDVTFFKGIINYYKNKQRQQEEEIHESINKSDNSKIDKRKGKKERLGC